MCTRACGVLQGIMMYDYPSNFLLYMYDIVSN